MRALLGDFPPSCRNELVTLLEEATPVGTWDWNIIDNNFFWSPRQFAHFGLRPLPAGWIDYETWLSAIHPGDRAQVQAAMTNTLATGVQLDLTFRVLWREEINSSRVDIHWLRSRGCLVRDVEGSPLRVVGTSCDVTEDQQRKALLEADREAQLSDKFGGPSQFEVYFAESPDCLVQLKVEEDDRFTFQMINATGLEVIGMSLASARGLTPVEVLGEANGHQMTSMLKEVVQTGLPVSYEPTFDYDAESVIYDATYMPIHDHTGMVRTILCRARDITAERRMEATLRQAQKMEALGQLAAGISHDFNNLLASLRGCFNRLSRLKASSEIGFVVELGSSALAQGEALTRQLLTFARKEELALGIVDANKCIEEVLSLGRTMLGSVEVEVRGSQSPCLVLADQGLLEAALLNILINARDARPLGCKVVVETELLPDDSTPNGDLPCGRYARLSITDNGPGIAPEVLARAMEPFFTTKAPGAGTGLGLSMVYGTARSFGGAAEIQSTLGAGTVVTIYLKQT